MTENSRAHKVDAAQRTADRPANRAAAPAPGAASVLALQAGAGNAAVARLFAQRLAEGAVPPVAPPGVRPEQDPRFSSERRELAAKANTVKTHPPAGKEVKAAQDAAVAPADDKETQAKAGHMSKMEAAKPAGFDKAGFIAAVKAAIDAKAPKTLDDAAKFSTSGKADQVKTEVMGKVTAGKEQSVKNVAETTSATPDAGAAKDKPVAPLPPEPAPKTPAPPDPKAVAPKPAPAEQLRTGAGTCEANAKMAEAGVTDEQLAKSNEPELTGALDAKKEVAAHDAAAPAEVRDKEKQTLATATADADSASKTGLAAMTSAKVGALQKAGAGKSATKDKDETERKRITGEIKKIFDTTKTEVEKILGGIDAEVTKRFEDGEAKAKAAFTADHEKRMWDYKLKRYTGPLGPTLWMKDLLLDMPAEANNLFLESKKLYETKMTAVISDVADFIGTELTRAKDRVAKGRADVQTFVGEQPANLQKIAGQAAGEIGSQFDELEKSVDEKQDSLVDDLAEKYSEARGAIDEEIKKLQDENKGLAGKAVDAVGGAIDTIKKLKDMLLGVLARAANAVDKIIKDPMAFLSNFINAVKAGIQKFMGNIVEHLKKGLQGWLFGALADAGIEIPEKLDLRGIITMLLSVFGLTWKSVRGRIVKQVGEPVMSKIETGVDFIKAIVTEGLPGAWKWIVGKLSDLKEQVMGQIREFVITKVITAGVTWLISLLNPAAAFIKACKMIYDAVMWFVDNAQRLKEFVDSVLDSVESIANGGVGAVAGLIENTLARAVPMLISGLASLLGLGGIGAKIAGILEKVRGPVGKAVDWLVSKAVGYGKKFAKKLKDSKAGKFVTGLKDKGKALYAKGKAKVKALYDKAAGKLKEKLGKVKAAITGDSAGAVAENVASAAANLAGRPNAAEQIRNRAMHEGDVGLGGEGRVEVKGVPTLQRTQADVSETRVELPAESEKAVRRAEPTNPEVAARILGFIQSVMPVLLAQFEKSPQSGRADLDTKEKRFRSFMIGKEQKADEPPRTLTARERKAAMNILTPARRLSRGYYGRFRDFAWTRLNKEPDLKELAKGGRAKLGKGDKAMKIEVIVTRADGSTYKRYRSVDFEHLTRVTDQPFKRHSEDGGEQPNLSPMLADLNRYFQEALRNETGVHQFWPDDGRGDEIEMFIVLHQLYPGSSPAARDNGFKPVGKAKPGEKYDNPL